MERCGRQMGLSNVFAAMQATARAAAHCMKLTSNCGARATATISISAGQFSADDQNQISGRWTERSRNIGGTAVGNASGDRLQVHVESSGFAADLVMTTRNRRQNVTIDSQGGGQVIKASISLSRS